MTLIAHTDVEARHPWPEDMFIQGGKRGVVFVRGTSDTYWTAFVEAFPGGTFIRGQGATVEEAEDAAWAKYQTFLNCDGTGQPHGPFEARHYENGSGFCTRCGAWMSGVCEPSQDVKAERLACDAVIARYGEEVPGSRWWTGLVADHKATLLAIWNGQPMPEPTTVPPTMSEYQAWLTARAEAHAAGLPLGELFRLLDRIDGTTDEDEETAGADG